MLALLAQVPVAENKCLTTFGSMDLTPIMKTECLMAQITITSTTRCMITLPMILASRICQSIIPRAILVVPLPMVLAILILSGIKSYNWSEVKGISKYFGQIQLLQTPQLHSTLLQMQVSKLTQLLIPQFQQMLATTTLALR